jgi:hypothetical protein
MLSIQFGNILYGVFFHSPFQRLENSWEFNLSNKILKTDIKVCRGRARVISYMIETPVVSFLVQKTIERLSLVKNI